MRPIHVDEKRRVAGHDNEIAVALKAGEPGRIGERRLQVGRGIAFARGPLADKNLRALAIVGVVVVGLREGLPRRHVEVLVKHSGVTPFTGVVAMTCRLG